MNPIQKLRQDALEKRDKAIKKARTDYRVAMRELKSIERLLRAEDAKKPRYHFNKIKGFESDDTSLRTMTVAMAAETVLREGKPMTLVDLTMEVQRRGCRTIDDPRAVLHAIRASFRYHRDKFVRNGEGRWAIR